MLASRIHIDDNSCGEGTQLYRETVYFEHCRTIMEPNNVSVIDAVELVEFQASDLFSLMNYLGTKLRVFPQVNQIG